jgi:hypothetical protein
MHYRLNGAIRNMEAKVRPNLKSRFGQKLAVTLFSQLLLDLATLSVSIASGAIKLIQVRVRSAQAQHLKYALPKDALSRQ